MQVYVLTKGWEFRAVTIAQYSQSQAGNRKRRQQLADEAASLKTPQDVEAVSHKASVVPEDDSSTHSSAHDGALSSKPEAEQAVMDSGSPRTYPNPQIQLTEDSRLGAAGSAIGKVATIPHPGGPGGRWEPELAAKTLDSSRSLAASSSGSAGKMAVVVPEAARFAALKSATLWRQLVRWQTHRRLRTVLQPCNPRLSSMSAHLEAQI
jgi:hypothetical protein